MSEVKERSSVFKFFYVILRVVTAPVYMLLFVLRHPIFVLLVLVLCCGVAAYFPLREGVALGDAVKWYQDKYAAKKLEMVTKAVEAGQADFVPEVIKKDVEEMQKKLASEAEEAAKEKHENYNDKVGRTENIEKVTAGLRKRSGFKKKLTPEEQALEDARILAEEAADNAGGGLAQIVEKKAAEKAAREAQEKAAKEAKAAAIDLFGEEEEKKVPVRQMQQAKQLPSQKALSPEQPKQLQEPKQQKTQPASRSQPAPQKQPVDDGFGDDLLEF